MREISLAGALDAIQSSKQLVRRQGLEDLEHVLKQRRNSPRVQGLSNDEFHHVLEVLFEKAVEDKEALVKAKASSKSKSSVTKNSATSRLSACSYAIRLTVEIGVVNLLYSTTIRAFFKHLIAEVRSESGQWYEELIDDYFKALLAVLNHRPHLEHIQERHWVGLVEVCCDALNHFNDSSTPSQEFAMALSSRSISRSDRASRTGTPALSNEASFSSRGQPAERQSPATQKRTDDMAACLEKLMSVHHINILGMADQVFETARNILRSTVAVNRPGTQKPCFGALNLILFEAITEDIGLASRIFIDCVYIIRRHWGAQKGASGIKEQMLVTLIRGQCLTPLLIEQLDESEGGSDLEGLLDRLMTEYRGRFVKEVLSLHDVNLDPPFHKSMPNLLTLTGCSVKNSISAEGCWAQLSIIADLFGKLRLPTTVASTGADGAQFKRRKVDIPLYSLVAAVSTAKHEETVASLQFLTFILGSNEIPVDQMQYLVDKLFPLLSRDSSEISNWSSLALAMIGQQAKAHEASTGEATWHQILQVAITKISSHRVSRLSCYLANIILRNDLVPFTDASDIIEGILGSVDVSGPALLDEASVGFWKTILALYSVHRTASYDNAVRTALRWLFASWKPSRSGLARTRPLSVTCVTDLLYILVGEANETNTNESRRILHNLSRACLRCEKDMALTTYLITEGHPTSFPDSQHDQYQMKQRSIRPSTKGRRAILSTVCDYLLAEIDELLSAHAEASQTNQLSLVLIRASLGVCIVACGLHDSIAVNEATRSTTLLNRATELRNHVANAFLSPNLGQDRRKDMTQTLYSVFEDFPILPCSSYKALPASYLGVLRVARAFGKDFWKETTTDNAHENENLDDDPMTIDESQESHASRDAQLQPIDDISGDWLTAYTDERAYQASIRADLCFAAELPEPSMISSDDDSVLPEGFVLYLTRLHPNEFCSTRPLLDGIYLSNLHIENAEAIRLLEFMGGALSSYEVERCETAVGLCVDLLAYLVKQWATTDIDDKLSDYAGQLYAHVLRMVDRKSITAHVYARMANMLQRVVKTNPEYQKNTDIPSARTILFQILASGSSRVRFDISKSISAVFGLFILGEHDIILNDIDSSFPHDPDSLSAMAVRLFLLSRLAAAWSTLIRRCVYAIVEATGISPEIIPYARSCLRYLGRELGITSQHELFRLFVSQILYTWLETRPVAALPYDIFDYKSLDELMIDCKHEIAAQVIMRGKESEVDLITKATGWAFPELLIEAFGRCAAYCIARDTAIAPQEDPQAAQAAVRLRKHVGKEAYKTLISERFPEIVAVFFRIVDREDQITKGFQKHERHTAAQQAYESMVASGASQSTPPVSQQPSFKSNYLIDELKYICDRSSYKLEEIWTPALYIFVFRSLLETVQTPLGPLHAAAVVRRIRILVSIGGATATSGYCLEMSLGSLRPYLANTHSADDVIGLYKYLLTSGRMYLKEHLPFLGGFVVSVLASLKAFIDRPQESTTQQSVFLATLTKAQDFHRWITEYALEIQPTSAEGSEVEDLKTMVKTASKLRGRGTSNKEIAEGELLLHVLSDQATGKGLIDEPSRRQIMKILSQQFQYAEDRGCDILASDKDALRLAPTVWKFFDPIVASRSFNLWALRALGRAYASTGFIDGSFRKEIDDRTREAEPAEDSDLTSASTAAVIRALFNIVCNNSTSEAGIAERTMQALLTRADADGILHELAAAVPQQALSAMTWGIFFSPLLVSPSYEAKSLPEALQPQIKVSITSWAQGLCISLIDHVAEPYDFLTDLKYALIRIPKLAEEVLPYVLHLVLAREAGKSEQTRKVFSTKFGQMIRQYSQELEPQIKHIINAIIYLRTQPLPFEKTKMDRSNWLDLDYRALSEVAISCKMFKTALLFVELALPSEGSTRASRRSSAAARVDVPTEALLAIFQNIDEKDYYYGVRQPSSLGSMMERLDFEGASFESLSFRGMAFDAKARQNIKADHSVNTFVKNLNDMQLSGLSHAIVATADGSAPISSEITFDAARTLEKWDIPAPDADSGPAVNLYRAFQDIQGVVSGEQVSAVVDMRLESTFPLRLGSVPNDVALPSFWASLTALLDMEEILTAENPDRLEQSWLNLEARSNWMESTSFDHIDRLLSSRETLFSVLAKSSMLRQISSSSPKHVRHIQVQALISSSSISRTHGNLQKSLSAAMSIEQLLPDCQGLGLQVEAAARLEASNVLWDQGQMAPSIQILRDISDLDLRGQDIPVSKASVLAKLASRVSEARLEQPDHILSSYLEPAIKELRGSMTGEATGHVFHEFASFCDKQLQDVDSLEDFNRVRKMRDGKLAEVLELDEMIKKCSSSKERESYKAHRSKAKNWYDIDDAEYRRSKASRVALLKQSLDNYLLCLGACDSFDRDAMRFSALWLQHHDDKAANDAVRKHLDGVSSSKFATLMNQWTSRLLDETNEFQKLLGNLVIRICGEHPYHAMYNMFASSKSKGGRDEIALSRFHATNRIVNKLRETKEYHTRWINIHNACINYQRFAVEKIAPNGEKWKQGMKGQLRKVPSALKLENDVVNSRVPPPTIHIPVRKDADYRSVPIIVKWSNEFSVASGISAPKIVTAIASDGQKYKMLFKSGNDDLRQDAIMEQVFEQVSELLQAHRETRQRQLGIRSYKVVPLTHSAGVIEFVPNTIPLHEYLVPAHQDHYPNDLKNNSARKIIQDAYQSGKGSEHRISQFRKVCEKFHPVLRFFFMERFENPDEWFEKRLAYTRSTAAISMLGHVLGLGDRHVHNILLDEKTGEVVHIDLGVAFEQGRVLPVPELVPFRLTRDIVDGMGVTKTEGVFRRCCEFTLGALRKESYGIMTVLDVLRFDPLYSWSMSPVRLRRLQADKSQADDDASVYDGGAGQSKPEKRENEEAEADRALTVVNKKLSKSLSVEATVNQLIQQATDEKNLALLFAGWAAYI